MGAIILPFGITVLPDLSILIYASPAGADMINGTDWACVKMGIPTKRTRKNSCRILFFFKST
jgi:hypothetical protein